MLLVFVTRMKIEATKGNKGYKPRVHTQGPRQAGMAQVASPCCHRFTGIVIQARQINASLGNVYRCFSHTSECSADITL